MSATPDMPERAGKGDKARGAGKPHPLRAISFGDPEVSVERRDDGTLYLRPKVALGDYPIRLTDRLQHWAGMQPHRDLMA